MATHSFKVDLRPNSTVARSACSGDNLFNLTGDKQLGLLHGLAVLTADHSQKPESSLGNRSRPSDGKKCRTFEYDSVALISQSLEMT